MWGRPSFCVVCRPTRRLADHGNDGLPHGGRWQTTENDGLPHTSPKVKPPALVVVVFDSHRFEVFSFEDLAAVQAFQVFDTIPSGNHLCTVVLASVLHKARLTIYSNDSQGLVKGLYVYFFES